MANSRRVDSGILQRGKSYTFTVALGMDLNGKQIRKTTTFIPPEGMTEKKADKLAKEEYIKFRERCKGLASFNENMRFAELAEEFFKVYAPNKLKETTAYHYKHYSDARFLPYFGNMKLKDISTAMLTDFFNNMTDQHGRKLKPSSVKRIYSYMQTMWTFAVNQRIIKESPCKGVILPSSALAAEHDSRKKFLSETELPEFMQLFDEDTDFEREIKILLLTGMRSGECLGLKWENIDFENRMIHITHTLSCVSGDKFLTTPKTKTSKRYIAMSSTVYELLKQQRLDQMKLQLAFGSLFKHPEMVFTNHEGDYVDLNYLNKRFKKHLAGTKFETMTLHCLRHSNATLLLNSGVDLKIVSEHLGHSEIAVTADIYTDVLESSKRKTAELIEFKLKHA